MENIVSVQYQDFNFVVTRDDSIQILTSGPNWYPMDEEFCHFIFGYLQFDVHCKGLKLVFSKITTNRSCNTNGPSFGTNGIVSSNPLSILASTIFIAARASSKQLCASPGFRTSRPNTNCQQMRTFKYILQDWK